jgi:hypothetical protein
MTDAELIAMAALVLVNAVEAQGENDQRRHCGECPAYRDHCGVGAPWTIEIEQELARRKVAREIEAQRAAENFVAKG